MSPEALKKIIRDVPDFPSKGIIFKDITPLLSDGVAFKRVIELMGEQLMEFKPSKLAGIESRGFIFASALANYLGLGLVLVRKKGRLPWKTFRQSYELEYGADEVELHQDSFNSDERVVIVDDVLATGGTALGAAALCKQAGANVAAVQTLIELEFLGGRKRIPDVPVLSLIRY